MILHQKMAEAMKQIGSVKKDKHNDFSNYDYVSETAIKTVVHKALVDNGILFQLNGVSHVYEPLQKGGMSRMSFTYRFTNVDDPKDYIEGQWESAAADSSDKSHTKAITYAIREIMKSNFVISTGEPDPDGETPEVVPNAVLFKIAHVKEMLGDNLVSFEKTKGPLEKMSVKQLESVIKQLETKQADKDDKWLNELPF